MRHAFRKLLLSVLIGPTAFAFALAQTNGGTAATGYLRGPFVLKNPTSLGPGFLGHDIKTVVASIERSSPGAKSEFETTAQYETRKASFKAQLQQEYVFVNDPSVDGHPTDDFDDIGMFTYDADAKLMRRKITMFGSSMANILLRSSTTAAGQYVGMNAFGVRKIINRYNKVVYSLAVKRSGGPVAIDSSDNWFIAVEIPMETPEAIALKSRLRIAFVCTVSGQEIEHDDQITNPTVTEPTEIHWHVRSLPVEINTVWVFDMRTGHILKALGDAAFSSP
jgi:hypothetical protein